jgi:hypothetical protein
LTSSGLGGGKSDAFQADIAQDEKLALKILRARFSCIIERVLAPNPLATNAMRRSNAIAATNNGQPISTS